MQGELQRLAGWPGGQRPRRKLFSGFFGVFGNGALGLGPAKSPVAACAPGFCSRENVNGSFPGKGGTQEWKCLGKRGKLLKPERNGLLKTEVSF